MRFYTKADKSINETFDSLVESLVQLEENFIFNHLNNPLATPNEYDLDVKAYCVLSHAAFEEYIEQIAIIVAKAIVENYKYRQVVNDALLMFIHSQSSFTDLYDEGPPESMSTIFDYLKNKSDDLISSFEKAIDRSHGFGYKYVNKLLVPLAIDITKDISLLTSYKLLTSERGIYAHRRNKHGQFQTSISPEKARDAVMDCTIICDDIKKKALAKL